MIHEAPKFSESTGPTTNKKLTLTEQATPSQASIYRKESG
jgi:hypothetical protein